jgi:hypothetical protein
MDGVMYREVGVEVAVNNDLAVSGSLSRSAIRCECAIYAISHGERSTWGARLQVSMVKLLDCFRVWGEREVCDGERPR